jgi:hypothetical protein
MDETETKQKKGMSKGKKLVIIIGTVIIGFMVLATIIGRNTENSPDTTTAPEPEPKTIDLTASVSFTGTQFIIKNGDNFPWTDVMIKINSGLIANGYWLRTDRMDAESTYTVGALQFAKDDGTRLNPDEVKPISVSIQAQTPNGTGFYEGGWN